MSVVDHLETGARNQRRQDPRIGQGNQRIITAGHDEGFITVVDRKKDMIKSGGENVASREVEEALYGIEGVSEVAVIGLPDAKWIEAVTAIIVPKPGFDLTEDAVIAACSKKLSGFKLPKRVILTDSLPKNPSGKLLKRELRLKYEALFKH